MKKKLIGTILVLTLVAICFAGCLDDSKDDHRNDGETALEVYFEFGDDIEQACTEYNVSLQSIDCYGYLDEGRYNGYNFIFYNFDDSEKKPSNVVINIENGEITSTLAGDGTPTSFQEPIDIEQNLYDTDEVHEIAETDAEIHSFLVEGKSFGVEVLGATLLNELGQTTWKIGYEYEDDSDQPFKTAYIFIDANTGDVVNVWGDGID